MIPLRLIEPPSWQGGPYVEDEEVVRRVYEVGDCWYATLGPEGWTTYADGPEWSRHRVTLAPEHERTGRRPMMVVITHERPPWCLQAGNTNEGSGWKVVGELPLVTVTPSIHMFGVWHGWVRAGNLVTA